MSRAPTARQHSNTENVRNSDRRFLLCAVSNKAGVTVELRVAPTGAAAAAARETIIGHRTYAPVGRQLSVFLRGSLAQ
jgi:hypothetical protein